MSLWTAERGSEALAQCAVTEALALYASVHSTSVGREGAGRLGGPG